MDMRCDERLFVYGTLRSTAGETAHELIKGALFLGPARCRGRLFDLGEYPGLVIGGVWRWFWVQGELYSVGPEILERVDEYEGCANGVGGDFCREHLEVFQNGASAGTTWAYVYRGPIEGARWIASGDDRMRELK